MLHQLHRRLAGNRFLSGESKEKRSSCLTLLGARLGNNLRIDIGENGRRLRTIKVLVSSCDKNNLAVPRQKFDWLLIPK